MTATCPSAGPCAAPTRALPGAAIAALLLALALLVRCMTLSLGTDVDTGCFLAMMRSMSEGKQLYRDILCNLTPLGFLLGAGVFHCAPQAAVEATRAVMIVLAASCVVPILGIGGRLLGRNAAVAAAFFYALDIPSVFYARQMHVGTLEGVISVWAVWVMVIALQSTRRRALWAALAGATVGVAFLVKQSTLFLVLLYPALALLFSEEFRWEVSWRRMLRDLAPFALGGLAVAGALVGVLWAQGLLGDFWRGVVGYNFEVRQSAGQHVVAGLPEKCYRAFKEVFAKSGRWLWLAALAAHVGLYAGARARALLLVLWLLAPAAFLLLFYYEASDHYFLAWTAPVCLLAGAGVAAAVELWRKWVEQPRLGNGAAGLCAAAALALGGGGAALAANGVTRYAWGLWAPAGIVAVRLLVSARGAPVAVARGGGASAMIALAAVLCAVGPYWWMPRVYPSPYVRVGEEEVVVEAVQRHLQPGEDVAVVASDVLTVRGGWRELPVVCWGRPMIAPMAVENALRDWSPNPRLLRETTALWESSYRVRFIVIYDVYLAQSQEEHGRPLHDYITCRFTHRWSFDSNSGDYYGHVHVFERRPDAGSAGPGATPGASGSAPPPAPAGPSPG